MAELELKIDGDEGTITFDAYLEVMAHTRVLLRQVDASVSGQKGGALLWYVRRLFMSSLGAVVESRPKPHSDNADGRRVVEAVLEGVRELAQTPRLPPEFNEGALSTVKRLAEALNGGAQSLTFTIPENGHVSLPAVLTRAAAAHVSIATREVATAHGSVIGRLDQISLRSRRAQFGIKDELTNRAVTCYFDAGMLPTIKEALGRRVLVDGLQRLNGLSEIISILVEDLIVMPSADRLPTVHDIVGLDANFTGGLDSVEYQRQMRDD